ncbi:exosortase A [Arsukibacterium sp.]|uniref:exosortase A n=1 Tax=Arsukibacterium sp. TaxID=1977258 RepID=UPI002FDB2A04
MTPNRTISSLLIFTLLSMAYLGLYIDTWLDMERVWRSSATYNHCYLILPISLYFFFKAKQFPDTAPLPSVWIWCPAISLVLVQLFWFAGFALDIALFKHLAAVLTLQAILWLLLGNENSRKHCFAIAYLIFLVPFGEELSPLLQNITADMTVAMLHLVNIPVYREGLFLATPVGLFEVAEACSGLRFLIASMATSVLFAYLHFNRFYKQVILVLFMAIMSILANGVRAFMLVYIGEKSEMRLGFGADHYLYGWLFFAVVLLAGFWIGSRFSDPALKLSQNVRQSFVFPGYQKVIATAAIALLLGASYRLSLDLISPPAQPLQLAKTNAADINQSNWGIRFPLSLAEYYAQPDSNIEYFAACYANKQQDGKLIGWGSRLYNTQHWQVNKRIDTEQGTILQLRSLSGQHRTVLYWYQVGEHRSTSQWRTKLYQAAYFIRQQQSGAWVFAVSIESEADAQTISLLTQAAAFAKEVRLLEEAAK